MRRTEIAGHHADIARFQPREQPLQPVDVDRLVQTVGDCLIGETVVSAKLSRTVLSKLPKEDFATLAMAFVSKVMVFGKALCGRNRGPTLAVAVGITISVLCR